MDNFSAALKLLYCCSLLGENWKALAPANGALMRHGFASGRIAVMAIFQSFFS